MEWAAELLWSLVSIDFCYLVAMHSRGLRNHWCHFTISLGVESGLHVEGGGVCCHFGRGPPVL